LRHLNHFRRSNAGGTIEGGEGFIKLQHVTADGGILFHQKDLKARVGDVQGGLHSGDTAANNHHVGVDRSLPGFKFLVVAQPIHGSCRQTLVFVRGLVYIVCYPGDLFTNGGHLEIIWVDPGPLTCGHEGFSMQAR